MKTIYSALIGATLAFGLAACSSTNPSSGDSAMGSSSSGTATASGSAAAKGNSNANGTGQPGGGAGSTSGAVIDDTTGTPRPAGSSTNGQ